MSFDRSRHICTQPQPQHARTHVHKNDHSRTLRQPRQGHVRRLQRHDAADAKEDVVREAVSGLSNLDHFFDGKDIRKVIFVPGKLINYVVH